MKTEKGVLIIAYQKSLRNHRILVLKRTKNWEGWELPKGHLENDDYRETVKLELKEEAGLDEETIQEITETGDTLEWTFENDDGEQIKREYKAFIAKIGEDAVVDVSENPHDEHETGFFLDYEDAEALLTYDNQKEILEDNKESLK
jgi:8-oxo-dGTP pyrophosphatase MutT (NUDIX family)